MVLITSDAACSIINQAEELKARVRSHASRIDENFKVGVEIEICLIDSKGTPVDAKPIICLLYTSPSPRDRQKSRMPSSA